MGKRKIKNQSRRKNRRTAADPPPQVIRASPFDLRFRTTLPSADEQAWKVVDLHPLLTTQLGIGSEFLTMYSRVEVWNMSGNPVALRTYRMDAGNNYFRYAADEPGRNTWARVGLNTSAPSVEHNSTSTAWVFAVAGTAKDVLEIRVIGKAKPYGHQLSALLLSKKTPIATPKTTTGSSSGSKSGP